MIEQAELLNLNGPILTEIWADGEEGAGTTLYVYTILAGTGFVKIAELHSFEKVITMEPHTNAGAPMTTALTFIS
jgi:hypothetical protein